MRPQTRYIRAASVNRTMKSVVGADSLQNLGRGGKAERYQIRDRGRGNGLIVPYTDGPPGSVYPLAD